MRPLHYLIMTNGSSFRHDEVSKFKHKILFIVGLMCGLGLYPFVLMCTVGNSKANEPADVALVLGARVFANGSPSDALMDRIIAGCELYEQGLCSNLLFSGGPGDGTTSEPHAMKRIAIERGIPESAIFLDEQGTNTAMSAINYAQLAKQHNWNSVIGVTHFYHTPRLKLALRREGIESATHSASQRGMVLKKLPIFMIRESIAWWAYTLRLL